MTESVADASERRRRGRHERLVFAAAFLTRLVYLASARPAFAGGVYWALSDGLLRDHSLAIAGQRTTDYEPLYPLFLAVCRTIAFDRPFVVQLLQVAVASLAAVVVYRLALALADDVRIAALAGVLCAIDPLLVHESALLSESAIATVALAAFAARTTTMRTAGDAAISGAWLGLASLARAAAVPVLPLVATIVIRTRGVRLMAVMTSVVLLVVAPAAFRNHAVNGSWLPTRGGMNLFVGNSLYSAALIPEDDIDLLQPYAHEVVARSTDISPDSVEYERVADEILTRKALSFMREAPLQTLALKLRNVADFFSPRIVPYRTALAGTTRAIIEPGGRVRVEHAQTRPPSAVAGYALWQSLLLAAAAVGVYRRRSVLARDRILWCVAAAFVLVHALYFSATRYRAPVEFVLLFYAAAGLQPIAAAAAAFVRHGDRRLVLEAAASLIVVRVLLWALPFASIARMAAGRARHEQRRARADEASRIGRILLAVSRRLPFGMTCLVEALAAQAMLRRRGCTSVLRFGVRSGKTGGRPIDAHAWLVCDGRVVVGGIEALRDYATLEAGKNCRS